MVTDQAPRKAILEAQVEAALAGHDLGTFEEVDTVARGYQGTSRGCGQTVWVGSQEHI